MGLIDKAFDNGYKSTGLNEQTAEIFAALQAQYPGLIDMLNAGTKSQALGELDTSRAVTPGYNDLALSEIERNAGRATAAQGQLDAGQAAADIANLTKYGVPAGQALRAADQSANGEYYAGLGDYSTKFQDALEALSPTLSAGNRAEIERGAARLNPHAGDGSAVDTAVRASTFGEAGAAKADQFARAITNIASALPALRTGLNPAALALGRDSRTGSVTGAITPVVKPSGAATATGQGLLSQLFGAEGQKQAAEAGAFKTWGDTLEQDSRSFANIAGGISGMGGG